MKKTAIIVLGLISCLACDQAQQAMQTPFPASAPRPNAATPQVEGRKVPDPIALPEAVAEVLQGPVQHQAPVTSFDVTGIMQVARCNHWLIASDASGGLHLWKRANASENFVARDGLHMPGLIGALSCAGNDEVMLSVGSMLVRVQLDSGAITYNSLPAKNPRSLALLRDGRVAVLDVAKAVSVLLIDAEGQVQRIPVTTTSNALAALPQGGFVVLDRVGKRLDFYDAEGTVQRSFSRNGTGSHDWDSPSAVQVVGDRVVVVDSRRSLVFSYDLQGTATGRYGENAQGQRELALPSSVALDGDQLWVASRLNAKLRRYSL